MLYSGTCDMIWHKVGCQPHLEPQQLTHVQATKLAESMRVNLAAMEKALDAREAKLQDSWRALRAHTADAGDHSSARAHSDQLLKVMRFPETCIVYA